MNIGLNIAKLRQNNGLSHGKFAEKLGLSRQAVQKWGNSTSTPDIVYVINIAKIFNVSIDTLLLGSDRRINEELPINKTIQPQYENITPSELHSANLLFEYRQSIEEGKDISQYKELFETVATIPVGSQKEAISDVLFNIVLNAKQAEGFQYIEPSALNEIKSQRPEYKYSKASKINTEKMRNKIAGAWMGRICGCLLGKPVEGIKSEELRPLLKESGNYPMHRSIYSTDITKKMHNDFSFRFNGKCYANTDECAPVDDDTNYTVLSVELIKIFGRDFTPEYVSKIWLNYQSKDAFFSTVSIYRLNQNNYQKIH